MLVIRFSLIHFLLAFYDCFRRFITKGIKNVKNWWKKHIKKWLCTETLARREVFLCFKPFPVAFCPKFCGIIVKFFWDFRPEMVIFSMNIALINCNEYLKTVGRDCMQNSDLIGPLNRSAVNVGLKCSNWGVITFENFGRGKILQNDWYKVFSNYQKNELLPEFSVSYWTYF